MKMADGYIQTVAGPVQASQAGPFLVHEHILSDLTPKGVFPADTPRVQITLENIWDIRYAWCGHYGNQILDDIALLTSEVKRFRDDGGNCIVEQTSRGLKPDPQGLLQISTDSQVPIVAGTGFYTFAYAGDELTRLKQNEIRARLYADLRHGFEDTTIRAGFIGEMGLSDPPHPEEIKALIAAAHTQGETGAGMCIHPPRDFRVLPKLIDLINDHHGLIHKTSIAHLERTLPTVGSYWELAKTGCYLELDFFGLESGYYPFAAVNMPNDAGRLAIIRTLIDKGHLEQILVSQDICHLSRLRRFGGEGYGHFFRNVVPMMHARGFRQQEIDAILIENPSRFLSFNLS